MQLGDSHSQSGRSSRRRAVVLLYLMVPLAFSIASLHRIRSASGQVRSPLQVRSTSFNEGGPIARRNSCEGANVSPGLQWSAGPSATRSYALIADDPDAPAEFTHWLVYDIPPDTREMAEGASPRGGMAQGAMEGLNSFGGLGYGGPCPPAGKAHHYVFRVFALDTSLALPAGVTREQVEAAASKHLIAEGQTVGIYRRGAK